MKINKNQIDVSESIEKRNKNQETLPSAETKFAISDSFMEISVIVSCFGFIAKIILF